MSTAAASASGCHSETATSKVASRNWHAGHSKAPALTTSVGHSSSTMDSLGATPATVVTPQDEASCTTHAANKDTITPLFVRLGGAEVVDALVGAFYDRVILDEKVRHIFAGLDVRKLAQHQARFLTVAFGGNIGITPIDIREIHEHLGLKDAHFDAVMDNLMLTMIDFGFSEELRDEVFEILEMQRPNVLNLQYYFGVTGEKQSLGCAPTCQLL